MVTCSPAECMSRKNYSGRGYVVALNITAKAGSKFIDLQCWAAKHMLTVVEPLINKSQFVFSFDDALSTKLTSLGDVFAFEDWHELMKPNTLAPIVKRGQFIQELLHFDKNLILVQFNSNQSSELRCNYQWANFQHHCSQDVIDHLRLVRTVCMNASLASIEEFDRAIFGELSHEDSLVIFDEWTVPSLGDSGSDARRPKRIEFCGPVRSKNREQLIKFDVGVS